MRLLYVYYEDSYYIQCINKYMTIKFIYPYSSIYVRIYIIILISNLLKLYHIYVFILSIITYYTNMYNYYINLDTVIYTLVGPLSIHYVMTYILL